MARKYKPETLLKRAMARMNNNGAHWLKGDWRGDKKGEEAFCMMGGIGREAVGVHYQSGNGYLDRNPSAQIAVIALAEAIEPKVMAAERASLESSDNLRYVNGQWRYLPISSGELQERLAKRAAETVMAYNDRKGIGWRSVSSKMRKAIEALENKKG